MQTENVNPLEKTLDLAVSLAKFEADVANRLKQVARTVKMQGFRPGKVPMKMVEQQHGGQVRQEVLGESVQKSFSDAVQLSQLRVAGYPRIEPKADQGEGESMMFTATFEVYPEVTLGDISASKIERPVVTVGDDEVNKTIDILRKQRVGYESVDRAAATGDRVNVDYRGMLDGVEFAGGQAKGFNLVLGEGRTLPDFEGQFVGMKAGENKKFDLTFPDDYHSKDLAGKAVTFEVTLNGVEEPKLPEIDADFAKSLGVEDGNLEKMRDEIRASLEREVKKRVQEKVKTQVMESLLESTKVDLPTSLVEMEIERLMEQMRQSMVSHGVQMLDGMQSPELHRDQAKRRVALGLILAEAVKSNQLDSKPEQIRAQVEEVAQSYEDPDSVVKYFYSNPQQMAEIESLVLEGNVVEWVLTRAQVVDAPTVFDELMGKK
ncbi:MAG: trigger factor [Gammaproteobacteria bacterium]|nr:trigger factor [Gammaproteobacteria bacterium]MBU1731927.1 trigger factor [Gammaproteobacteria bacterium]MBU1893065.1 trigger factor [Gammaproteobacteria bacterium]